MKNINRIIALIISLCILTVGLPVGASVEQTDDNTVISKLRAFGIIGENSVYTENENITRAKYTALLVKAINAVPVLGTSFADVAESSEYAASINTAKQLGIVHGDGSNYFNPDAYVKYDEAIKMAMAALGYNNVVKDRSSVSEYMTYASSAKITQNAEPDENGYITGYCALVILNNMLDTKRFFKFSSNGTYSDSNQETAAEYFFGITKLQAYVKSADEQAGLVEILINDGINAYTKRYKTHERVDVSKLFGDTTLYIDGDIIIYAESEASVVIYDFIEFVNNNEDTDALYSVKKIKKITFKNSGETYNTDNMQVYFNDAQVVGGLNKYTGCFAKAYINSGKIVKLEAYELSEGGIIYRADRDQLRFSNGSLYENRWDGFENLSDLQIYIDGKRYYNMTDLKIDMTFDYFKDGKGKFMIVASSRMVEGVLEAVGKNSVVVKGEEYSLSEAYSVYSYSRDLQRYVSDPDYTLTMGKNVQLMIDDRAEVRYIRDNDVDSEIKEFAGVVIATRSASGLSKNAQIKLFRVDGGQVGEHIYDVSKKLKKSDYGFSYVESVAGAMDGTNFFKFKLNGDNEIVSINQVPYWGNMVYKKDGFHESYRTITGESFIGDAVIFAVMNIDGKYTVKTLNYDKHLAGYGAKSDSLQSVELTVISDFDIDNNPFPKYVMLGNNADKIKGVAYHYDFVENMVKRVDEDGEEYYSLRFCYDGTTYKLSTDIVEENKIAPNKLVAYFKGSIAKDPIVIASVKDLSEEPDNWPTDTYYRGAGQGFYKADTVVWRTDNTIQFEINGEKSSTYLFSLLTNQNNLKVFELTDGEIKRAPLGRAVTVPSYWRPFENDPVINIQPGDKVWFQIRRDTINTVDVLIYESANRLE